MTTWRTESGDILSHVMVSMPHVVNAGFHFGLHTLVANPPTRMFLRHIAPEKIHLVNSPDIQSMGCDSYVRRVSHITEAKSPPSMH